ncbi:hypothetical protein [Bacillus solitudinis]|uniref:hypothetical protein n=1 Tax=Bacillus solitudinis TaxID=2014074 RepID=UPI000C249001|nr:hypothetical protein [Bacillus solitudinis]
MLTFEQKLTIAESFPELERKNVSLNRVNFHFEESTSDKKNVVYHLHPNGNGYVYAEKLSGYKSDSKGMVNIRDFSENELRTIITQAIESLEQEDESETNSELEDSIEENWVNREKHTLTLIREEEMWNVYAGNMLDGTFPSYNEAKQYLDEEGFKRID